MRRFGFRSCGSHPPPSCRRGRSGDASRLGRALRTCTTGGQVERSRLGHSTEPLAGWREVAVRVTKTKVDRAVEMARILEGRYADCEKVILVCDNLNTPTKGAFLRGV